jgi:hypothetical protein
LDNDNWPNFNSCRWGGIRILGTTTTEEICTCLLALSYSLLLSVWSGGYWLGKGRKADGDTLSVHRLHSVDLCSFSKVERDILRPGRWGLDGKEGELCSSEMLTVGFKHIYISGAMPIYLTKEKVLFLPQYL